VCWQGGGIHITAVVLAQLEQCGLPGTDDMAGAAGCWLLLFFESAGCWLLAAGCSLLRTSAVAAGYWMQLLNTSISSCSPPTPQTLVQRHPHDEA
jgi:hypothetical protein